MFKAYNELPNNYQLISQIDMKKNKKEFLLINILALSLFFLSLFTLLYINKSISTDLIQLYIVVGCSIIYIVLHELVHALFFKFKNNVKVNYKFHGFAASAGVPGYYYQKKHYLIISLAPFMIFNLIIIPLFLVNDYWFFILAFLLAIHISGCSGDLYVFIKLLFKPKTILIEDYGVGMNIYNSDDINKV